MPDDPPPGQEHMTVAGVVESLRAEQAAHLGRTASSSRTSPVMSSCCASAQSGSAREQLCAEMARAAGTAEDVCPTGVQLAVYRDSTTAVYGDSTNDHGGSGSTQETVAQETNAEEHPATQFLAAPVPFQALGATASGTTASVDTSSIFLPRQCYRQKTCSICAIVIPVPGCVCM